MSKKVCKGLSKGFSMQISKGLSKEVSKGLSKDVSEEVSLSPLSLENSLEHLTENPICEFL